MNNLSTCPAPAPGNVLVFAQPGRVAHAAASAETSVATSAMLMRILDLLDYGVILASDTGRIRFANRVALRECAANPVLRMHDGHLQARCDEDSRMLSRALAGARCGRRALLTFRSRDPLVSLAVVPVGGLASDGADDAALLVLGKRHACEPLSVEFFAREHRLTTAETAVLRHLTTGARPGGIARECGVALSTVRTHISSIRMKIGARSVEELLRLVTALPPIVPAIAF